MKRDENKIKLIVIFVLLLLSFVKLALAGVWAIKENYIYAAISAVTSIIWAIVFSAVLICFTIKHEIEEMKKLIDKNSNKDKEKPK
ncbi:MAG: hypothetical protein JW749_04920 [Sedimentisphaerales bacterium]|nr:hypothetical protein [Sedimentisphaerales bacterium]